MWRTESRKRLKWKVRVQLGGVAVSQAQGDNGLDSGGPDGGVRSGWIQETF